MIHPEIYHCVKMHGPITRRNLARAVGMSERQVRAAIHEMNMEGIPIVSSGDGFYLSGGEVQIGMAVRRMKSAALSILKRCAALQRITTKDAIKQLELFAEDSP